MIVENRYCYIEFASSLGKAYYHIKDDWQNLVLAKECAEITMTDCNRTPRDNEKLISYKITLFIEIGF